jgi:hypothetical protein
LTGVAAWLVYAIARQLDLRPLLGVLAAVLVTWFANASMISMEGSNPTKLTLVPGALAVYAFLRALPRAHLGWAALSGAAGVVAGLAKQPGLLTLLALFAYTLFFLRRAESSRALQIGAGLALGVVAALVPVLFYLSAIGSLGGFVDQAWRYNAERFLIGYWQTPAGLTSPATRIDRVATEAAGWRCGSLRRPLVNGCSLSGGSLVWWRSPASANSLRSYRPWRCWRLRASAACGTLPLTTAWVWADPVDPLPAASGYSRCSGRSSCSRRAFS